jgi:hypothetical protein
LTFLGKVKAMQDTMVTERKPLIAIKDFPAKVKTTKAKPTTETKEYLTIDDLAEHKQKLLSKKILYLLIVVNLLVLVSIIIFA